MPSIGLNHMTTPRLGWRAMIDLAAGLGCAGVELRNDLGGPLFGGDAPREVGAHARRVGIAILALAQVERFNYWTDARAADAEALLDAAARCGARGVALIPRNDGRGTGNGERQANLRLALRELAPLLAAHDLAGFIEPLGFETSSLRDKADAVDAIEAVDSARFLLVHDTFHHHLAGGGPVFAEHTGIVHISGVDDPVPSIAEMRDEHRGLVGAGDRLGTVEQIAALLAAGYSGALSMESFAPSVHALQAPDAALAGSFEFVRARLAAPAA